MDPADPHADQPLRSVGQPIESARYAMVLLHGRGSEAADILGLAGHMPADRIAFVAPEAEGHTWYPQRFLAPLEANQPKLGSALARVDRLVTDLAEKGIPRECQFLLGFSQGACLAAQYVAEHPSRYAGVFALTGGLIGPPGTAFVFEGRFDGTPVYLGSGDPDPHVPWDRVEETARVFEALGAAVTLERFPGRPHTVSGAELDAVRRMVEAATQKG